jgi:hypothetical protein
LALEFSFEQADNRALHKYKQDIILLQQLQEKPALNFSKVQE